jgi:hypothetical protein
VLLLIARMLFQGGVSIRDIGVRAPLSTKLKLWLLNSFRIRPDGKLFSMLKKMYVALMSSN